MKINDILGLGKILPIDKLIEIVSNSVGKLSKPYFDKKDVDTKAYEIEKLAEARAIEMKIMSNAVKENYKSTGGIEYNDEKIVVVSPRETPNENLIPVENTPSIEQRTEERINFQQSKKQLNIESITAHAADELKDEEAINNESLDEDWTTRFFRIAEDISNEEMQALWGKILAGEIKQPKTYSLRTLEIIRNLSKSEADTFTKVANFAIKYGNSNYLFLGKNEDLLEKEYNINYSEIALLTEIGLIQPGTFVHFQMLKNISDVEYVFTTKELIVIANVKANTPDIFIPVNVFSKSGSELIELIRPNPPFEYLTAIAKSIKSESVSVKYGQIIKRDGNKIRYTNPLKEFA